MTIKEVRNKLAILKARDDGSDAEMRKLFTALFDLVQWLTERELKRL